jgi:hypothetical protein
VLPVIFKITVYLNKMKRFLFYGMAILIASSCVKDARDKFEKLHGAKWSGTYAAPLVNVDLNLNDAVGLVNGFAQLGNYQNNLIYLAYDKKEYSIWGYEMVKIPDQNYNENYALNGTEQTALTGGSFTLTKEWNVPLTTNGILEADSVYFSKGLLKPYINNQYNHPCSGTITFPDVRLNNNPLVFNFNIPAYTQFNADTLLNLVKMNLTQTSQNFGEFKMQVSVTWTNSGQGFSSGDLVSMGLNINNANFNRIYGLFGSPNLVDAEDSLKTEIFGAGLTSGSVNFDDPRLKVTVDNNTGIPLELQTSVLSANVPSSGAVNITNYPATFNVAAVAFANAGQTIRDSFLLTKSNSNIKTVIDQKPSAINYKIKAKANASGSQRNFINANSRIFVNVVLELPFSGIAADVVLEDTAGFEVESIAEVDYVDWITFRVNIENQMPLSIGFQGYFMDSAYKVLDSLFQPFRYIANAATVDAGGNVVQSFKDGYDVTFDRAKLKRIQSATQLRFRAVVPTASFNGSQIPVKISTNQHLYIKLGVQTKLSAHEEF